MGYEPILDAVPHTNVDGEHVFKIRATFGASSAVTYRSKDATIAKTDTAKWTITLPKVYAEITEFSVGWYKPTGAASLNMQITTNSVASDGTLVIESVDTNSAGSAAAPASGDVAYITIGVSCSTLNDEYTG